MDVCSNQVLASPYLDLSGYKPLSVDHGKIKVLLSLSGSIVEAKHFAESHAVNEAGFVHKVLVAPFWHLKEKELTTKNEALEYFKESVDQKDEFGKVFLNYVLHNSYPKSSSELIYKFKQGANVISGELKSLLQNDTSTQFYYFPFHSNPFEVIGISGSPYGLQFPQDVLIPLEKSGRTELILVSNYFNRPNNTMYRNIVTWLQTNLARYQFCSALDLLYQGGNMFCYNDALFLGRASTTRCQWFDRLSSRFIYVGCCIHEPMLYNDIVCNQPLYHLDLFVQPLGTLNGTNYFMKSFANLDYQNTSNYNQVSLGKLKTKICLFNDRVFQCENYIKSELGASSCEFVPVPIAFIDNIGADHIVDSLLAYVNGQVECVDNKFLIYTFAYHDIDKIDNFINLTNLESDLSDLKSRSIYFKYYKIGKTPTTIGRDGFHCQTVVLERG